MGTTSDYTMKKTLLELTQDILNDLDGDEVNSINDTVEATQVANIVRSSYEGMINKRNWPHLKTVSQLSGVGDTTSPTKMQLPDGCKELVSIYYNKRKTGDTRDKYSEVVYMAPDEFLIELNGRDSSATTVMTVVDYGATKLFIRNNKAPAYWTSFDDDFIIMDSYDTDVDTTLQQSKTQAVMYKDPSFTFEDTFVPDLPSEAFTNLLEEAKSTASLVLRQMPDEKAEQKARRQSAWLSRKAWKATGGIQYPNFGRRR